MRDLQARTIRPSWFALRSVSALFSLLLLLLLTLVGKVLNSTPEWSRLSVQVYEDPATLAPQVLGSGCVAQVLRASKRNGNSQSTSSLSREVAVKLTHPHVRSAILADTQLLQAMAAAVELLLPSSRAISLSESVREFRLLLLGQLDMSVEAAHLERFRRNFGVEHEEPHPVAGTWIWLHSAADRWRSILRLLEGEKEERHEAAAPLYRHRVTFPEPLNAFTTAETSVLVESLEEGRLLSDLLRLDEGEREGQLDAATKKEIAQVGLHAVFKMIFVDNFIHAGEY